MFNKSNKKTITIEGMHCDHCAKKVESTLKNINGVDKVKVNLTKKEATIYSKIEISNQAIQDAFKELDFQILNIK